MSVERPCVLVGVTGCIAAYKAGEIVRGLQKAGVRVKVVMTEHGTHFVDPVTFRALTHEKVAVDLFDDPSDPIHHISLAQECDVFLIAPCTANVMAKVVCGIADDLLSTTALATTATLAIAPAANVHMYEAAATQENMATLRRRGVRFIEGGAGYLACGDVGRGRLADPAVIVRETLALLAERVGLDALREACEQHGEVPFATVMEQIDAARASASASSTEDAAASASAPCYPEQSAEGSESKDLPTAAAPDTPLPAAVADGAATMPAGALAGRTVLVTAGPTVEPIDSVRYISNYSSGKMGYAIAGELADRGACVTLVTGRTELPTPAGVERVDVLSAAEMYDAAVRAFEGSDGAVMCAAVADYTPDRVSDTKIKKCDGDMCITLRRTRDIAAELGAHKGGRLLVGFALETHDEQAHAEAKLEKKNFDFIVLNSLRDAGAGFRGDTNKVTFIDRTGREELPLLSKREVAERIAERIEEFFAE